MLHHISQQVLQCVFPPLAMVGRRTVHCFDVDNSHMCKLTGLPSQKPNLFFRFHWHKVSPLFCVQQHKKKARHADCGQAKYFHLTEFWPKESIGPTSFSRISAHSLRQDSPEAHEPKRIRQTITFIYMLHVFLETSCSSWCICARNFYSLFSQPRKCQRNYQMVKL